MNRTDFRKLLNQIFGNFLALIKPIELIFSVLDSGHSIWSVSKIWFYFKTTFIFKTSENQTTKLEKYSVAYKYGRCVRLGKDHRYTISKP